tara:strand:+ start:5852 stop:6628 length:777 start_codon:yes stop_codon:yes gene_type:complete
MTKNTIAINDSPTNDAKSINKYLLENLSTDYDIVFNSLHGKLFHIHQTMKPKLVVWSASQYTQEFHDYITEHQNDTTIILLIDIPISQQDLIDFIKNSNVNIILNTRTQVQIESMAQYDRLYEDDVFFNKSQERNDKTLVLLSQADEKNQKINELCYPTTNHKIVVAGNPEFDSPVNLGVYNLPDLAFMLNRFKNLIDIEGNAILPAQACEIPCIDTNGNLKQNFKNNVFIQPVDNLQELTYKYFVNQNILPFIRNKI